MMKTRLQVFALLLALASVCAVVSAARAAADPPATAADAAALKEIARYKSWTRVTKKPVPGGILPGG